MGPPDIWQVVSRMLAVLTIGHSSVLLLSKLIGLSEAVWPKLSGKLVECVGLMALIDTSALIVSIYVRSGGKAVPHPLPWLFSPNDMVQALRTYFFCAGLSLAAVVSFWLCYLCARRWPSKGLLSSLVLFAGIAGGFIAIFPLFYLLELLLPRTSQETILFWLGLLAIISPSVVMAVAKRVGKKSREAVGSSK